MKFSILFVSICAIGIHANAQLISGDLVNENRSPIGSFEYKLEDSNTGLIYFNIAVNRKGEVTSAKVDSQGTTIISTPSRIKATAYVKKLKFQEGTHFPEFHHARVKLTLVEPKAVN